MVCPTLPLQKLQPAVFILGGGVNKILLEYNYTHLFIHCYWREWNSLGLKSQKYLLLGLLPKKKKKKKKKIANPCSTPKSHSFYKLLGKLAKKMNIYVQFWKFAVLPLYARAHLKINSKPYQALKQGNIPPLGVTELEMKPLKGSWMKPHST